MAWNRNKRIYLLVWYEIGNRRKRILFTNFGAQVQDVVVENFRPGDEKDLSYGYDDMKK